MQASVHTYDEAAGDGSVLLDDGRKIAFSATVFAASGLRRTRVGQRVSVTLGDDGTVTRLWIVGIGAGEPIR